LSLRLILFLLAALTALLQYRLWVGEGSLPAAWALETAIERTQARIDRLQARNQALEAEVEDLKTALEAVEERARMELGMIGPGETFYQVIRDAP